MDKRDLELARSRNFSSLFGKIISNVRIIAWSIFQLFIVLVFFDIELEKHFMLMLALILLMWLKYDIEDMNLFESFRWYKAFVRFLDGIINNENTHSDIAEEASRSLKTEFNEFGTSNEDFDNIMIHYYGELYAIIIRVILRISLSVYLLVTFWPDFTSFIIDLKSFVY